MAVRICLSFLISSMIILPLTVKCKIRIRHGLAGILITGLCSWGTLYGLRQLISPFNILMEMIVICLVTMIMTVFIVLFRFYRNPDRTVPDEKNIIVCPADGTIRYIKYLKNGTIPISEKKERPIRMNEFTGSDLLKSGGVLIGIEMSIMDVHVNRAPVSGKVIELCKKHGSFHSLRNYEALKENQRVTMIIDHGPFMIGVIQIASRLVRQIVTYIKQDEWIEMGQRIGMIRFGSQVDLFIPHIQGLELFVHQNQQVTAGETPAARYDPVSAE